MLFGGFCLSELSDKAGGMEFSCMHPTCLSNAVKELKNKLGIVDLLRSAGSYKQDIIRKMKTNMRIKVYQRVKDRILPN